MGGQGSGGPRAGSPGRAYTNRSDLNKLPIRTTTGQTYGQASAQRSAQSAIPMAAPPSPSPSAAPPPPPGLSAAVPLNSPTSRPEEPVTAGLNMGAGPGSEALFTPPDPAELEVRALYALYPNNDLLDLLTFLDQGRSY